MTDISEEESLDKDFIGTMIAAIIVSGLAGEMRDVISWSADLAEHLGLNMDDIGNKIKKMKGNEG